MLISIHAQVAIGDTLYPVNAEGEVVEVSAEELKTKVTKVEGLPFGLSFGELNPTQVEAVVLALEAEFERRHRALHRLPQELRRVLGQLRRAGDFKPLLSEEPLHAANNLVGALRFAVRQAESSLESLLKEVA